MKIKFRQGIISYSKLPSFISLSGNAANLIVTKTILLAFSHGRTDYLYTEKNSISNAWSGPFNNTDNYWLYWDIDLLSATRNFNHTIYEPSFGTIFPNSPNIDQHFFNLTLNKMFFWNGLEWIECVRIFAGTIKQGKINIEKLGSQVNLNFPISIDEILFDFNKKPLKKFINDGSFIFLTKDDKISSESNNSISIHLEDLNISGVSSNFIPKYYCVIFNDKDNFGNVKIKKTSYFDLNNEAVAITSDNMNPGEIKQLITNGYIQDSRWLWTAPPLSPLFVGGDGEISLYVNNPYTIQKIGYIVNSNTIFVNFNKKIYFV